MNRVPFAFPMAALLLVSPPCFPEAMQGAAFEPAPVFEDDDLHAKAKRWVPRTDPIVAERTAAPVDPPAAPTRAFTSITPKSAAEDASSDSSLPEQAANVAVAKIWLAEHFPIVLIVLAMVGFIAWSTRTGTPKPSGAGSRRTKTAPAMADAGTGVERYLKSIAGVAAKGAETGVARYLKSIGDTTPAARTETGVARYLKNRI